jgi:cell division transport system ATP-binding protein
LALAEVVDPKNILDDEPTGSLDRESAGIIMAYLDEFHSRGATVVLATHDKELIKKSDARVVQLRDGGLSSGPPL